MICCILGCLSSVEQLNVQRAEEAIQQLEQYADRGNVCVFGAEVQRNVQLLRDLGHEVHYMYIS